MSIGSTAPPGWYHDGVALRWWDGSSWGPYAPAGSGTPHDKTAVATVSHLGFFAGFFVLPLVLRLTAGRDDAYVRHHSTEALNFMILFAILWNGIGIPGFVYEMLHPGSAVMAGAALSMMVLAALVVGTSIVGAVRASQGVWWRYPVNLRVVRGAVTKR